MVGEKKSFNERPPSVFFMPSEELAAYEDLTSLPYLYDETVLDCIISRYKKDLIYTWAGPILVAVNPAKSIKNLYNQNNIKKVYSILKGGNDHQDPHVFTVAGLAHSRLSSEIGLVNQAVLVSGESGAGKTESAKFLLTYLTKVELENPESPSKGEKKPEDIQRRILASNPILEAFGNAATLRNHNSSRFGKLIQLQYNGRNLKGATVDTYLLEKTRVTNQPANERNFHIFYQLLSGVRDGLLPELGVLLSRGDKDSFRITPHGGERRGGGGGSPAAHSQDLAAFKCTIEAFQKIRVSPSEQREIFQVVAAIMYLGNVSFELNVEKEAWILSSSEESRTAMLRASELLGLPIETLSDIFTTRKIKVTTGKETTIFNKVCEREDECRAIYKLIYKIDNKLL